jgi:hypothetical protein
MELPQQEQVVEELGDLLAEMLVALEEAGLVQQRMEYQELLILVVVAVQQDKPTQVVQEVLEL